MNFRVLTIAAVFAVLVLGSGWFLIRRSAESTAGNSATLPRPTPIPEASRAAPPSPEPDRPAVPSRAPRTTAEPAPAEAPPAASDVGTLHIDSDVPGALVFIDRQPLGRAPVTADRVAPGTHVLNVSAEGFEGIAETIEVMPGSRDILVRLREVRLDVSIAVVHKHRIGSCAGRLTGTLQGVRFETTNKDDAFQAALGDLEVFQVDYLQKNLKLKPRRGKEYNFTDPEGNADRLLVFQRDVQKARERLAKGDTPASN
jgi:PEGA domain